MAVPLITPRHREKRVCCLALFFVTCLVSATAVLWGCDYSCLWAATPAILPQPVQR